MYRSPVSKIKDTLFAITELKSDMSNASFGDLSEDVLEAILEEAGKFASERIAPLNKISDTMGASLKDGEVTLPTGFKQTYKDWVNAGWNSLSAPQEFGGQGLPLSLAVSAIEMWSGACQSFTLGPVLTLGAIEAIDNHGSEELKAMFGEQITSGEWAATMNLTEPQAGTDLAALKAKAEAVGDGTYKISGQKIFISYGEHDLTSNICHLVLARLPNAPKGVKGISLFLVPKFMVREDGSLGQRNDVFCQSLEHKMGLHGSPTCVMIYGDGLKGSVGESNNGAIGYLIGEENKGLNCMFTMMNNARLNVGIQGVAIGEAAYQHALNFAKERKQGKAISSRKDKVDEGSVTIIHHPDVARSLLTMNSHVQAARSICYACAYALDKAKITQGAEKKNWQERASLLTPIAKAFSTDIGTQVASLGVQVFGGMGYIEESGAAQYLRDSRINQIYEGTNGIQAIDLVMRKLPLSNGQCFASYLDELRKDVELLQEEQNLQEICSQLIEALSLVEETGEWLLLKIKAGEFEEALSGATPFLQLMGLAIGAVYLAKLGAYKKTSNQDEQAINEQLNLASYFAQNHLPECAALKNTILHGAPSLLDAMQTLKTST